MRRTMALIVSAAEIEPLLDMPQAIAITRDMLLEQAAGKAAAAPPRNLWLQNSRLRVTWGGLMGSGWLGLRVHGTGTNGRTGTAVAVLFDSESGQPVALMGFPYSTIRTGSMMAVATDLLARHDASRVVMLGTGRNALGLLQGCKEVRRMERVQVHSRDAEHRATFAQQATEALGVPVQAVDDPAAAVAEADIVYVSTNALEPVFRAAWLRPGLFVGSMGLPAEVEGATYLKADRLVISSKKQEEGYADSGDFDHPLLNLKASGELDWAALPELSDVAAGTAPGRTSDHEAIVFREAQGGFHDVALAAWAYEQARARGVGQEVPI